MSTENEAKKDRRYRAVQYAGWLLAFLSTLVLFAPKSVNTPLHNPQASLLIVCSYLLGANIVPLTALIAGIASTRRLWSFGALSLVVYSVILLIALNVRAFS